MNAAARTWTRRPRVCSLRGSTAGGGDNTLVAPRARGTAATGTADVGAIGVVGGSGRTARPVRRVPSACSMSVAEVNRSPGSAARAARATSRNGRGRCSVASGPGSGRLPVNASTMTAPTAYRSDCTVAGLSRPALRGEIAGRTQDDASHGHVVGRTPGIAPDAEALCDAEVRDLRVPVVEEDVARLDVPVHDAELVGGGQRSERLRHDEHDPLPRKGSAHDFVSQRDARAVAP